MAKRTNLRHIKTPKDPITEIGFVLYEHHQASAVYGLMDMFQIANLFMQKHSPQLKREIRVSHWRKTSQGKIECVFDTHPDNKNHKLAYLVVPPSLNHLMTADAATPWARWMVDCHDQGVSLCSVCSGAFVLGATGLLNGRSATTHWFFKDEFQSRFPSINLEIDKMIIDDGDMITAGGLMAWTDLGLKLIDRIFGSTVMLESSQFLLVDPSGREQKHYSHFSPRLQHGDENILQVQHWLQTNALKAVSLKMMATKAKLEERTFIRRFQKATEMNPTEYCQHVRVSKAREFLEFTKKNIDQISWDIGYEDTGAFRKIFHRIVGLSPGEYRSKFTVT